MAQELLCQEFSLKLKKSCNEMETLLAIQSIASAKHSAVEDIQKVEDQVQNGNLITEEPPSHMNPYDDVNEKENANENENVVEIDNDMEKFHSFVTLTKMKQKRVLFQKQIVDCEQKCGDVIEFLESSASDDAREHFNNNNKNISSSSSGSSSSINNICHSNDAVLSCHKNTYETQTFREKECLNLALQVKKLRFLNIYGTHSVDDLSEICQSCNVEKILDKVSAMMICPVCSQADEVLLDCNRPFFKGRQRDATASYKRMNHFNELLAQFQGKQNPNVHDSIYELIRDELKKMGINNYYEQVNAKLLYSILKKKGKGKQYENIPCILYKLTGKSPPTLSKSQEDVLRRLFWEIQQPWLRCKEPERKNFMSYSYVFYKFFQMLKMQDMLQYFPLLKSKEKLIKAEHLWSKICECNGWIFRPCPLP